FAEAAHKRLTDKPDQPASMRYYYDFDYENRQPAPFHPSEFLFAALCLADPALVGYGEILFGPMLARAPNPQMYGYGGQTPANAQYVSHLRAAWDHPRAARAGAPHGLAGGLAAPRPHAPARRLWLA